jgi:hypothetical protein
MFMLTGTPVGFIDQHRAAGGLQSNYYFSNYNNPIPLPDGGNSFADARSTARTLQSACMLKLMGLSWPPTNYPGAATAFGSYEGLTANMVQKILATQDAGGGWMFQYTTDPLAIQ